MTRAILLTFLTLSLLALASPGGCAEPEPDRYFDFSGQAREFIKKHEKPVTPHFREFAKSYLKTETGPGSGDDGCTEYTEATQLFLVDIDQDGQPEGLIAYTIEGCGGGNNATRSIALFRKRGGMWSPAGTITIGSLMTGFSHIVSISNGTIKTGENDRGDSEQDSTYVFRDGLLQ